MNWVWVLRRVRLTFDPHSSATVATTPVRSKTMVQSSKPTKAMDISSICSRILSSSTKKMEICALTRNLSTSLSSIFARWSMEFCQARHSATRTSSSKSSNRECQPITTRPRIKCAKYPRAVDTIKIVTSAISQIMYNNSLSLIG